MSILNHSVASELEGQQQTWSSPFASSRRSAENNRCPCISLSLTLQRHLILSAETVSSRLFQGHSLWRELASGRRTKGRPQLRYKDVCKRDITVLNINTKPWEDLAADCMRWRSTLNQHLKSGEEKLVNAEVGKRTCIKEHNNSNRPETTHKCDFCGRDFLPHRSLQPQMTLQQSNRQDTRMYSHDQT